MRLESTWLLGSDRLRRRNNIRGESGIDERRGSGHDDLEVERPALAPRPVGIGGGVIRWFAQTHTGVVRSFCRGVNRPRMPSVPHRIEVGPEKRLEGHGSGHVL